MKTKLIRFSLIAAVLGAFVKLGVSPSIAADSTTSDKDKKGGCCGKQAEAEVAKNCPAGSTWNSERKVCLEPNGTPRAPLN